MRNYEDFAGCFGDFQTMFLDTDFDSWVVRFYTEDGDAIYKNVIGYTELDGDILLHMVDCEGIDTYDELAEAINRHGVSFQLFSDMVRKHGFCIIPYDQLATDDDDGCEDCDECGDCEDDGCWTWTCHCGNVNGEDELMCLKCKCFREVIMDDCEFKVLVEFGDVLRQVGEKFAADLEIEGIPQDLSMTSPRPAEVDKLFRELTSAMKELLNED